MPPQLLIRLLPAMLWTNERETVAADGATVTAALYCANDDALVAVRGIASARHANGAEMVLSVVRAADGVVLASKRGVEPYGCDPQFAVTPHLIDEFANDELTGTEVIVEYRVSFPTGEESVVSINATIEWLGDLCDE